MHTREQALRYHREPRPGKTEVVPTKPFISQTDQLGVRKENLVMVDSKGVIYKGRREGMNPCKAGFAAQTETRSLSDAAEGIDLPVGMAQTLKDGPCC